MMIFLTPTDLDHSPEADLPTPDVHQPSRVPSLLRPHLRSPREEDSWRMIDARRIAYLAKNLAGFQDR